MAIKTMSLLQALVLLQPFTSPVQGLPTKHESAGRSLWSRVTSWTNPLFEGWYADPDAVKFGDYWVYATVSGTEDGTYFDAFSSPDMATWTKHSSIYTTDDSKWATKFLWAPCTVERDSKYYFYYTANDPSNNNVSAGIGVAVGDAPGGPFTELTDTPIVEGRVNGAAAMDQQVFIDDDGKQYLLWGNPRANIAPLNDDMKTLGKWEDGSGPKDITPSGFVEGSYMLKHNGKYYFMWSENFYWDADYRVAYGMSDSITGPFERIGAILTKDDKAEAPGHHSVLKDTDGKYYIFYHRRAVGDNQEHRVIAADRMYFNEDGTIKPIVMT